MKKGGSLMTRLSNGGFKLWLTFVTAPTGACNAITNVSLCFFDDLTTISPLEAVLRRQSSSLFQLERDDTI
jgi:hypothetical protein